MLETNGKYRSWIPHGFDYYSPGRAKILVSTKEQIRNLFQKRNYQEVILPAFDYARTFRITSRQPVKNQIFETRDSDGDLLGVRSDLTVQVIKGAANGHFGTDSPHRLFYIQPVYHDIAWGSGSKREIIQGGVELIDGPLESRFQEVLSLAREIMAELGFQVKIVYGDARFVEKLFSMIPEEFRQTASHAFHLKDTQTLKEIASKANLSEDLKRLLVQVPLSFGSTEALNELEKLASPFEELKDYIQRARAYENVIYDFSLVRELSYYTGPVFEGYVEHSREKIISGGVYDHLHELFCGRKATACGFAVNLTELIDIQHSSHTTRN